jgi:hypothetical protein
MTIPDDDPASAQSAVVLNWLEELRRLLLKNSA